MKASVVEGYHDMLAFYASSKVETLPPTDTMSALSDLLDRASLKSASEPESSRILPS